MKTTLTLFTFLCITTSLLAQTSLPYYSGFNNETENDGWEEFNLGATESFYYWSTSNTTLSHDYPVGGTVPTEDWWVSPEFDFSSGATIDSLKYRFSGFGNPAAGDTIALYIINGAKNPENASAIIMLRGYTDANYQNDNVWRTDTAIHIPAFSGESHLAFRYTTTDNWLVASFDDLYISGSTVGVKEGGNMKFSIYPNPTTDILYINSHLKGEIELFNIAGNKVLEQNKNNPQTVLDISSLPSGVYFLHLGNRIQKIIKN